MSTGAVTTTSAAHTGRLAASLGRLLRPGDFIALTGDLGSGKTRFVQGVAMGLGVGPDQPVTSPTFTLIQEYDADIKLYHIDAYRLSGAGELADLGLLELIANADSVIALEWADRVGGLIPDHACRIELAHRAGRRRRISVDWPDDERLGRWIAGWCG